MGGRSFVVVRLKVLNVQKSSNKQLRHGEAGLYVCVFVCIKGHLVLHLVLWLHSSRLLSETLSLPSEGVSSYSMSRIYSP